MKYTTFSQMILLSFSFQKAVITLRKLNFKLAELQRISNVKPWSRDI